MSKRLTLTFDNGPTPGVTERVLESLESRGLKATFFLVGQDLAMPENRELTERTRAAGHWLGNHTMTHGTPLGLRADPATEILEIAAAEEVLNSFGPRQQKLFRPNGSGSVGPHLLSRAALDYLIQGEYTVVLWDVYVRDVHEPDLWVDRALRAFDERDWSVLVCHDLPSGAMDDLPRLLDTVLEAGTEIVQEIPDHVAPVRRGVPSPWVHELTQGR